MNNSILSRAKCCSVAGGVFGEVGSEPDSVRSVANHSLVAVFGFFGWMKPRTVGGACDDDRERAKRAP